MYVCFLLSIQTKVTQCILSCRLNKIMTRAHPFAH